MFKENISVSVRLRPLNAKEIKRKEKGVIKIENNSVVIDLKSVSRFNLRGTNLKKLTRSIKSFNFNKCFCSKTENAEIHDKLSKEIVLSSLRGINSTIFVYGQTGSGKTHSITGDSLKQNNVYYKSKSPQRYKSKSRSHTKKKSNKKKNNFFKENDDKKKIEKLQKDGILYLSLKEIFKEVERAKKEGEEFVIKCSYIEIYKDNIYDLLREEYQKEKSLTVYEDCKKREFKIKDNLEEHITSYSESIQILEKGEQNRHFAITNFNHNSSRSHTIFRIFIKYLNKKKQMFESVCNFVDLAGSEKLSRYKDEDTYDRPARIKESKSINKSLFFLTQIIHLKGRDNNETFIPYRNSPLTKILKNSIGGNAKTAIMICINPALGNLEQSLSSLNFGNLAAKIENKVRQNEIKKPEEDLALKNLLSEYKSKIKILESEVTVQNKKNNHGFQNKIDFLEKNKKAMMKKYNNLLTLTQNFMIRFQDEFYVEKKFKHIKNCGNVDYYVLKKGKKKSRKVLKVNNFFEENKEYTKQLFKTDLILSQKNKIKDLEEKNLKNKILLEKMNYQINIQKKEIFDSKNLLNLFLNRDFKLLEKFKTDLKENLIQNSLNFIENIKTDIINNKLKNHKNEFILSFKENKNPNLTINNLRNLINKNEENLNKDNNNKNHLNYSITFKNSKEFSQNIKQNEEIPRELDLSKLKLERKKTDEIILEKEMSFKNILNVEKKILFKNDFKFRNSLSNKFKYENKKSENYFKIEDNKSDNQFKIEDNKSDNQFKIDKNKSDNQFKFDNNKSENDFKIVDNKSENDFKIESEILENDLHSKINEENSFVSNFEFSKLIISEAKVDFKENQIPDISVNDVVDINFKKKNSNQQKSISPSYLLNN